MKHCLKCRREFSEAHRFCGGCGGPLSVAAQDGTSTPSCPNCAVPLRAGWKFCGKCQTPLAGLTGEPQPSLTKQPLISESALPSVAHLHGGGSLDSGLNVPGGVRCPACHLMVDADDGDFCEHCGSTLLRADDFLPLVPEPEPPSSALPSPSPALQETLPIQEMQRAQEAPPAQEFSPEYEAHPVLPTSAVASDEAVGRNGIDDTQEEITSAAPKEIAPPVAAAPEREEERANGLEAPAFPGLTLNPPEEFVPSHSAARHEEVFEDSAGPRSTLLNRWVLSGGAVLCLLLVGAIFLLNWGGGARSAAEPSPAPASSASLPPSAVAPEGMVLVSGGSFEMGRNDGDEYERPAHAVSVKAFYLDAREVTCEQYAKFVTETGHAAPPTWPGGRYDPASARLPVTGVNWTDAQAYARWAGARLPTEEEWEFAARGTDGRLYPWGNGWQSNAANAAQSSAGRMVAVGSFASGASPFGALDMVGNAWEWTASSLKAYPGGRLPEQSADDLMVIRGNYWNGKATQATATFRRGYPARDDGSLTDYAKNTGFR
nr:SUMF1/EgtB/PvdO family nonheme iron enzyme [Acidobacteriota bacterium]